jgi:membrane protein
MTEKREVFWSLGGLPFGELLRRTLRESWHDEVFGQAGRMAFYHFLAIFPSLLVFLAISARVPHMSGGMRNALHDVADQVLPGPVAQLFRSMVEELGQHARSHAHLLPVLAGACWAALNGTWAMVYGLNNAYEVEERRSWHRLGATIVSLTVTLAMSASLAIFLIFCGRRLQGHVGVGDIALRSVEWTY